MRRPSLASLSLSPLAWLALTACANAPEAAGDGAADWEGGRPASSGTDRGAPDTSAVAPRDGQSDRRPAIDATWADGAGLDGAAQDGAASDALPDDALPGDATPAPPADGHVAADGPPLDPCQPIPGAGYDTISPMGPPSDRPPPMHGDLNLHLRGWAATGGSLGLVDINGPTDSRAPKLNTLLPDDRVPGFVSNYRVHQWDWGCNCRGGAIEAPEVTMTGFATRPGEILELPRSGYEIGGGDPAGPFQAMVLYVDDDSITLKYTREDNVVRGYTIHLVNVCVEPALRALYRQSDAAGRGALPALRADQPLGRARGAETLVTIRDTGAFMDPRSRKDWW